ncbi:uncharacterized protein LOC143256991 isoform X2 [Tachypleus tridentatus]|uniref:uncharacterized protein LOC143256991 isoform X2 n=1 Tax=Tachypleus tridentatus TaxID=6853 RepID=UPI003FD0DDFE
MLSLRKLRLLLTWLLSVFCPSIITASRKCYFPSELQGHYIVQAQASPGFGGPYVRYSDVTVEKNSITPWGRCEQQYQKNIILSEKWKKCMRCFHLTFKTPNVIQIHTEGFTTCHTTVEAALATCPDEELIFKGRFTEIMMYRKNNPRDTFSVQNVFCPINGRFRFTFHGNNGNYRCDDPYPELSNCPYGNTLEFRFHQCTFPDTSKRFLCLGDWQGLNNERYVALMDLSEEIDTKPRFRCGLYGEDSSTGRRYLSLSEDSTCVSGLVSSSNGYETFSLTSLPSRSLPAPVLTTMCEFPSWFQGRWENVEVSGNKFVYEDYRKLQAITAWCVTMETNNPFELFHIYTITQCGDEAYNCVWLQQKARNIMEIQLGVFPSSEYIPSFCHSHQFDPHTWITLGRIDVTETESCRISGTYTGAASGGERLCAKLAADCENPDILFYSIRDCKDNLYSYREREYRCLGNWEENGILYTYVQRQDIPGFQCLSGKLIRNEEEVSIKDTGQNCLRGYEPYSYDVKVTRNTTCSQNSLASDLPTRLLWRPYTNTSSKQLLTVAPSLMPTTWLWNPPLNYPTQSHMQDSPYERSRSHVTQRHHNDLPHKFQPAWRPTYVNSPPLADPAHKPQPTRPPWRPTYVNSPHNADPAYRSQPSRRPWRPTYINNPIHADPAYRPQSFEPPWRPTYVNSPPPTDPAYRLQPSRPPLRPTYLNILPRADQAYRPQPSIPPWRPARVTQPSGKEDPIKQTRQHWKPSVVGHQQPPNRISPNNQRTKISYQYPGRPFSFTTPSWRPITGRPRSGKKNHSVSVVSTSYLLRTLCVIYLVIFGHYVELL